MKTEIEKLGRGEIKLKVLVEKEKVSQVYEHVVSEMAKNAEVKGFRKGEAPRNLVEPTLDKAKIRGEIINHLIPESYDQAIKETHLKPIMLPRIELSKFEDGADLEFTATTCEAPVVSLGDYKAQLTNIKLQNTPQKSILGPDGQPINKSNENEEDENISRALNTIVECSKIEIADVMVEEEVNRMLGRLVDQTGRLGITVDQYLASVGKDAAALKVEYKQAAEKTLKLEFLLMEVSKAENVSVTDEEIDQAINASPDEQTKKSLAEPGNRAYIRSVLLKNKTIQKLLEYSK